MKRILLWLVASLFALQCAAAPFMPGQVLTAAALNAALANAAITSGSIAGVSITNAIITNGTMTGTTISTGSPITSTVLTGTAPFIVSSTTQVTNLNASQLVGNTWAIPAAIGSTTPNSGTFTTLSASSTVDGLVNVVLTTTTTNAVENPEKLNIYNFNNYATPSTAVAYTLPTAVAGKQRCYKNYGANYGVLTINTSAAGQYIDVNGSLTTSGGNITSGGGLGDGVCFVGADATHWVAYVNAGVWSTH